MWNSPLESHREICAVLAAVSEVSCFSVFQFVAVTQRFVLRIKLSVLMLHLHVDILGMRLVDERLIIWLFIG